MKLLLKFSILFVVVLGTGLGLAAWIASNFLQQNAHDQVVQQARLMMATSLATRVYTSEQIRPLLQRQQQRSSTFYPQTVPAFAAISSFNYLRKNNPAYTYREPALNPTNLDDRAVDWEADVINNFRNDRARSELLGERNTPLGRSLFLARPIKALPACLECHSVPANAPPAMVKIYGKANGFGWKPDEIVAAQIVSIPESVPFEIAGRAFNRLIIYMAALAILTLVILDLALAAIVVRPVSKISAMADRISTGDLNVSEIPVKGQDEIALLTRSFNRMGVSLRKAMKLLEEG